MKLCFATNNKGKLIEIQNLLNDKYQIVSLQDIGCTEELEETRPTLEGNSLQKAEYVFNKYKVNCFADDTGLEVEALNGAPGVISARYAGLQCSPEDNMNLLLSNLDGVTNRKARFRTIITLIMDGHIHYFEGTAEGEILTSRSGKEGFGYDPIFRPAGFDRSFAEMSVEEKNQISHRAKAVKKMVEFLNQLKN
jgi:XTP/dITP diphosphohydrolase